jgi:hypothetical protein
LRDRLFDLVNTVANSFEPDSARSILELAEFFQYPYGFFYPLYIGKKYIPVILSPEFVAVYFFTGIIEAISSPDNIQENTFVSGYQAYLMPYVLEFRGKAAAVQDESGYFFTNPQALLCPVQVCVNDPINTLYVKMSWQFS